MVCAIDRWLLVDSTLEIGYNDHGYNEFTAIMNKTKFLKFLCPKCLV